ncbi:DMT family protein [Shewanella algae]|uniref:DMT family protein n=1 Tax=Shewanella algae TaxID=38313 RepID=UPI003005A865
MQPTLITIGLLCLSNIFMTFAWYGHLKSLSGKPWIIAALVSWGIALFEYLLQVPANRIGYSVMNVGQLKILQEVITLSLFVPFAVFYLKEGANKSHVCSASIYRPGCKAWFAANGPSPLQEAQHSRQVCKPRPLGLSQQPALCVIRLRHVPACLQSDALNANCCASQSATRAYLHLP